MADAIADCGCYDNSPSPRPWAKKEQSLDEELVRNLGPGAGVAATAAAAEEEEGEEDRRLRGRVERGHREIRFRWDEAVLQFEVSRWIEPDGHNQLHFPRTKWMRDVPDWSVED
ncbi:hypothetical protein MMC22_007559 [Lobaria immixta]|nr:hypothetical protein [Lobaria immixta]